MLMHKVQHGKAGETPLMISIHIEQMIFFYYMYKGGSPLFLSSSLCP